jgi:4-deoxy-L-threo-5-hexosulose-uronate ketol-isomerase
MAKSAESQIARSQGGPDSPGRDISALDPIRVAGKSGPFININIPHPPNPEGLARMGTDGIRSCFLLENLFKQDHIVIYHSEIDRASVGGAVPGSGPLDLEAPPEFRSDFFAQRRELGVFNIGGPGVVRVDGTTFRLAARDAIFIGRGSRNVRFESEDGGAPALYYFVSYPAHSVCESKIVRESEAEATALGSMAQANRRTIRKYISLPLVTTSQLTMGLTILEEGSVWNTMPAHRHSRRSEIYFYFDMPDDDIVIHCLGEPAETRHVLVRNREAVIAPGWSVHFGVGTHRYSFIWAMGGENRDYTDMDAIPMRELA